MEEIFKEFKDVVAGWKFIAELKHTADIDEGEQLETHEGGTGYVFWNILRYLVHSHKHYFTDPII